MSETINIENPPTLKIAVPVAERVRQLRPVSRLRRISRNPHETDRITNPIAKAVIAIIATLITLAIFIFGMSDSHKYCTMCEGYTDPTIADIPHMLSVIARLRIEVLILSFMMISYSRAV